MIPIRWILVSILIAAMQVLPPLQVPIPVTPPESVNPQTYGVPVEEKLKRYDPEAMLASVNLKQPVDLAQLGNDVTNPFGTPYDVFVFEYASASSWDILSYQKNATPEVRYLANSGYHEAQPRMSPQRDRVAFVREDGTDYELVVVNADGSGMAQLTSNAKNEYYPAFSPDGQWIVYQSYQDGQSEIYKIKVDGSSKTRLTARTGSYEGMPAWSPDGSTIAYVSNLRGTNLYDLYLMNPDGSNQRRVTSTPYWTSHPAWSADGRKIAFDAGYSENSFQSLWYYSLDTNQVTLLKETAWLVDLQVNSYLTGDRYIGYAGITYAIQNNTLIITGFNSRALALETDPYQVINGMPITGPIWQVDWRSTDPYPPVTTIQPLPAVSGAPLKLKWAGDDASGSGITGYDVRLYSGAVVQNPYWYYWPELQNLTTTQYSFEVSSGETYTYQVRAKDAAGNIEDWKPGNTWTTRIETLAPGSAFNDYPRYAHFLTGSRVSWISWDVGGSDILGYKFSRECENIWYQPTFSTNYFDFYNANTSEGQYYLVTIDRAQNTQWCLRMPTPITLYTNAVTGKVYDLQGKPVFAAQPTASSTPVVQFPSDKNGNYTVYTRNKMGNITWSKSGYGSPDALNLLSYYDNHYLKDVYLPPSQNLIANGYFENGAALTGWLSEGSQLPLQALGLGYLGDSAGGLGGQIKQLPVKTMISDIGSTDPQIVVDSLNTSHLIWLNNEGIYYAQRPAGGVWTTGVLAAAGTPETAAAMQLIVTPDNVPHVTYVNRTAKKVFYTAQNPDGSWKSPEKPFGDKIVIFPSTASVRAAVTADGGVYLNAIFENSGGQRTWIVNQTAGVWGTPWKDNGSIYSISPSVYEITGFQNDSAIYIGFAWNSGKLFFGQRQSAGDWSEPAQFYEGDTVVDKPILVRDNVDGYHLFNLTSQGPRESIVYFKINGSMQFSAPMKVAEYYRYGAKPQVIPGVDGKVYLLWTDIYQKLNFRAYDPLSGWGDIEAVPVGDLNPKIFTLKPDTAGAIHFFVYSENENLIYVKRNPDGSYAVSVPVNNVPKLNILSLMVDQEKPNFTWTLLAFNGEAKLYDKQLVSATAAGDSRLSQTLTIPVNMLNPGLGFMYRIAGMSAGAEGLKVTVTEGETTTTIFESNTETEWAHAYVDMSAWKDKTITLTFASAYAEGARLPSIMLDEVMLGSTYPDAWVKLTPDVTRAMAGEEFNVSLTYATRGLPVEGVELALELPVDVEFVSADVAPVVDGSTLRWSPGVLTPLDGEQTINLTLRVKDSAAAMQVISLPVSLSTSAEERETQNNSAAAELRTEITVYIPAAAR